MNPERRRRARKPIFIAWVFIIALFIIGNYIGTTISNERIKHFHATEISGTLEWVGSSGKSRALKILGDSVEYIFNDKADKQLNNYKFFRSVAEPGDSVYKAAYGDTIFLFRPERVYKWTYYQPD